MNGTSDIKAYINRYFSQDLQYDETPGGAMERKQLRKWMLDWAKDYKVPQFDKQPELPGELAE